MALIHLAHSTADCYRESGYRKLRSVFEEVALRRPHLKTEHLIWILINSCVCKIGNLYAIPVPNTDALSDWLTNLFTIDGLLWQWKRRVIGIMLTYFTKTSCSAPQALLGVVAVSGNSRTAHRTTFVRLSINLEQVAFKVC